jgi:O-antigen/teichoic acid export membrane protein
LVSGTVVAQLLPLIVLPVLTKAMGGEAFGIFSLFFTSTIMLGTLIGLRFEYAISAAKSDSDAFGLLVLCFILNIMLTTVIAIIVSILIYFELLNIIWLLLPLSSITLSINQSYYAYANYKASFGTMSKSKIINAFLCSLTQLVLVYFLSINEGAYIGIIVGYALSSLYLFYLLPFRISDTNYLKIKTIFFKYNEYPKLIFPGTFLNFISGNLPIYFLGYFFGPAQAGYYSLATRVAGLPTMMIGRSIGEVFRSRAKAELTRSNNFTSIFTKVSIASFTIAIIGYSILFFLAPLLFQLVFGDGWSESALFVQILIPMFIMQFTTAPIAYSLMLSGWQKQEFYWQILRLVSIICSIGCVSLISDNIVHFMWGISFSMSFTFIVYFLLCFYSSRISNKLYLQNDNDV